MSSKDEFGEASRGSIEASSTEISPEEPQSQDRTDSVAPVEVEQDRMKRAAAKKLIERYFYQITDGCGNPSCGNVHCASSGAYQKMSPNDAAALAIRLFGQDARLCENTPNKVPRTDTPTPSPDSMNIIKSTSKDNMFRIDGESSSSSSRDEPIQSSSKPGSSSEALKIDSPSIITEESMADLCNSWETSPYQLRRALSDVFSQPSYLARCFPAKPSVKTELKPPVNPEEKEAWRAKEKDPDKDEDTRAQPSLDMESCRRAFQHLKNIPQSVYSSTLITSLTTLADNISTSLSISSDVNLEDIVNCFLMVFELPGIGSGDFLEKVLPAMCDAAENLSPQGQAKLAKEWALHCKGNMRYILESLQQLITIRVMSTTYTRYFYIQDDARVTSVTKLMKILYYANMLAGVMESSSLREEEITLPGQMDPLGDALDHLNPYRSNKQSKMAQNDDPLADELKVNVLDSRKPYIPFEEFYNETLSDNIEMDKDFACYKAEMPYYYPKKSRKFSFMRHSFILTPATKCQGLYYDNRIRMYSERRVSLLQAVVGVSPPMPYLKLKVRRHHLIEDALIELEMVAMERALDLKKQLVVEFEGEQGVDEGGVSKEFFQLIVEEIFNPDYGMFTQQTETSTTWFNPTSFESEAQFTLIGIVLGLAIYNNIILPLNFPMVVYRKLMGKKGSFEDLADWNPLLYTGLKDLLEYNGDDMQDVYMQTFRICYQDVFGNNIFHELKENGDQMFVTQENKHEFVDMYADFLLNVSVESQFKSFRRGFVMVTDESPLSLLFRPEEIEQLVCGSKNFDFNELQQATEYDGGYTADSDIIKDFWSIVHSFSIEDKRKLLQFATGSDRVPVGGLSRLKLIIARNGPDCDRLPTAHTCFNVLLLPEYDSKEKLNDRLVKAINYAKGFGML